MLGVELWNKKIPNYQESLEAEQGIQAGEEMDQISWRIVSTREHTYIRHSAPPLAKKFKLNKVYCIPKSMKSS